MIDFSVWNKATGDLPWGAQRVFINTLEAVRDEKAKLVFNNDYVSGTPCLVNAAATMLSATDGVGGNSIPTDKFPDLVYAFDSVNTFMQVKGINTGPFVSPLAAEILLKNFGPIKEKPFDTHVDEAMANVNFEEHTYVEPKDEDFMRDWLNSLNDAATIEENLEFPDIKDQLLDPNAKAIDWDKVNGIK